MTVEQAADAVLAQQTTAESLEALAARDDPDPWTVADELIGRGRHDAALAFARAAVRKDTERLAAYVDRQRGRPDAATARQALHEAEVLTKAEDHKGVLARTRELDTDEATVASVRVLWARGFALRQLEEWVDAEAAFLAAAERAARIGWLARAADAHLNRARVAFKRNDWKGALGGLEARITAEARRGNRRGMAEAISAIGQFIHARRGQYRKALDAMSKALALYEELDDKAETALVLRQIGTYLMAVGDLEAALETQERSLAVARSIPHDRRVSGALLEIARIHKHAGHLAKALPPAEEALAILTRLGDRRGESACLSTLGSLYSEVGDLEKSLAMQKRSLALKDEIRDPFNYGITLLNLGNLYARMGELDLARDHLQRSLRIAEELNDKVGISATLAGLGDIHNRLGEPRKALPYLRRALDTARETDDPHREATQLLDLSWTLTQLRKHEEAEIARARVVAIARAHGLIRTEIKGLWGQALSRYHLRDYQMAGTLAHEGEALLPLLVGGLSDRGGILFRDSWTGLHVTGIAAAMKRSDAADTVFFFERYRSGALLEALGGRELARDVPLSPELQAEERAAQQAVDAARAALRRGVELIVRREARQSLRAAQDKLIAVVEKIQRASRDGALVLSKYASLADLQAGCRPGDALLLMLIQKDITCAVVVTRSQAAIVRLSLADIDAAAGRLALHDLAVDPAEAIAALRKLVVEPLQLPPNVRRVLVVPHGTLAYVPFSLLLPNREVAYVPSGTTLLWLQKEGQNRGKGVLALGDPAYGRAGGAPTGAFRGSTLETLPPLPGTRHEVEAVGTHKLLGDRATETSLVASLPLQARWRAVHFACHGLANSQEPLLSALAVTPDPQSDGYLTCQEVFGLKMPTDLAVLSACETGRGATYNAEGIVGFTRAFMYAGAPRVICSLWKVDDEATRALMIKFYELWNPKGGTKSLPAATALRKAQEHVRGHDKWKHPYFWAAWTLWGVPD